MFWHYDIFRNTSTAATSLFALQSGDMIYQMLTKTCAGAFGKQLYMFVFILLFYTALQNILFVMILEGFEVGMIQKKVDNDDPWPNKQLVRVLSKRKLSTEAFNLSDEESLPTK